MLLGSTVGSISAGYGGFTGIWGWIARANQEKNRTFLSLLSVPFYCLSEIILKELDSNGYYTGLD